MTTTDVLVILISVSSDEILIFRELIELLVLLDENELKAELRLDTLLDRVLVGLIKDDNIFPGDRFDMDRPAANPVIALRTNPDRTFKLGVSE